MEALQDYRQVERRRQAGAVCNAAHQSVRLDIQTEEDRTVAETV